MNVADLETPALLLHRGVLERNLERMQLRADGLSVSLRPHMKTHKCVEIGRRQVALGACGITVSTFREAELFAEAGFTDITWALPLPPVYAARVWDLANNTTLRVLVDGSEAIDGLEASAPPGASALHVWLKIDCGYHRVGVDPKSARAEELVRRIDGSRLLSFDGALTHSGHAYGVTGQDEARRIAEQERVVMVSFAERMRGMGLNVPALSVGSTPASCAVTGLEGVTEMRPGNYALFDAMQATIGSCRLEDCAVTVLASVISHQPGADWFVTDAGALSLSKDRGAVHIEETDCRGMGSILSGLEGTHLEEGLWVESLSQEHGKVAATDASVIEGRFKVGEKVRVLEHHSCLTVAQFDRFYVVEGEKVVDEWKVMRGR